MAFLLRLAVGWMTQASVELQDRKNWVLRTNLHAHRWHRLLQIIELVGLAVCTSNSKYDIKAKRVLPFNCLLVI